MVAEEVHTLRLDLLIRALGKLAGMRIWLAVVEAVVKGVHGAVAAVCDVARRGLRVGEAAVGFAAIAELAWHEIIRRVAEVADRICSLSVWAI